MMVKKCIELRKWRWGNWCPVRIHGNRYWTTVLNV